jgi:Na+-driven multidrug efflux pump
MAFTPSYRGIWRVYYPPILAGMGESVVEVTEDPALLDGARAGLWALVPAMLLAVPGETFYSAVAGTGDTVAMLIIQVLMSACALLWAYAAALVLEWPLGAVWLAEAVGWVRCLLAARAWLRGARWQRLEI